MPSLPAIPQLIQRTKALAALDLILSPDWDSRHYSFNAHWSPDEQIASMRNGSGDEWWIVFHQSGWAAMKGLDHESSAWSKGREKLSTALNSALPPELKGFAQEPAFCWEATSFAYYRLSDASGWKRANDQTNFAANHDTGEQNLLSLLVGGPGDYVAFADGYYEKSVPLAVVVAIYALQPITETTVAALNPETTLAVISSELFNEIAYPAL